MARLLGEARVSVLGMAAPKAQWEAEVKKGTAGVSAKIPVTINSAELDARLKELKLKLDQLSAKTATVKIKANDAQAQAKFLAIKAQIARLTDKIPTIKLEADAARAEATMAKLNFELDKFSHKRVTATADVNTNRARRALSDFSGFIGGAFTKDTSNAFGNAGNSGSSSFGQAFASNFTQSHAIAAAVILGLAALPAAIGVIGVLGGIALGAGIVIGAELLIKSRLKALTTDITAQTAVLNSKTSTAAQKQAAQQALASDRQQVAVLNQQAAAFVVLDNAVKNLKNTFLNFAAVVSKPLIKPFADAINALSDQLGPGGALRKNFGDLFKAVVPLVKPVTDALFSIVNGILPPMTDLLNKARGPLAALFEGFGKIVGTKLGQWFRDAIPYIKVSGDYFLRLLSLLGDLGSFLIKFGGQVAVALHDLDLGSFGRDVASLGNSILKLIVPAIQGWTAVMIPVAKVLIAVIVPLLAFLAAHPALVKAITEIAAAWFVMAKAIAVVNVVLGLFDLELAPLGVVVLVLAAAIAVAAILIVKYWKPISGFFVDIWKHIWSGAIGPMINFFTNSVPHAFGVTINWLKKNWPLIVSIIGGPLGTIVAMTVTHWGAIFNFIKGVLGHIENVVTGTWKPIASVTEAVWGQIYKIVKGAVTAVVKIVEVELLIVIGLVGQAWRGIKNLTGLVWPWIYNTIKDAWGHIENATTGIVKPMVNWIISAWADLKNKTVSDYQYIFNTIKNAWGHIENITTGIVKPMVTWVESAWNVLKNATRAAYDWIFNTIKAAWGHIENVTVGIVKPMVTWVESAWNVLKSVTKAAFIWIYNAIKGPLQAAYDWIAHSFVNGVKSAFGNLVNTVKSIWSGLKKVVADPINFVIGIWNKFAGFVDAGLSVFGIKKGLNDHVGAIRFAKGGHVPGYAPGSDTIRAMLSPGEFVLNPKAVKAIGVKALHAMNALTPGGNQAIRKQGNQAFANGGDVVNDIEKWNGHRYVWGGGANPTTGWDCSSFVNWIVGHDFKLNLPGGGSWASMTNNGQSHGPVAAAYNNWNYGHPVAWSGAKKGDLAIEDNGAHIGFIIQDNVNKSSNETLMGFAARSTATGTGYEQFFPGGFHLERFADDRGFGSQVFDNTIGAVLKAAASAALNGVEGLVNGALNHIPGAGPIPVLAKDAMDAILNAAKAKITGNQNNYQFTNPAATGPAGSGTSAGEMANGKQIYNYLLANLFGGHKIAAAGATASIWGESMWNPFAQGTGGRGLIGWTPPSTISNADFAGGMRTQLPAILRFVVNSGDLGAISQMFQSSSVAAAANLWGRDVERFGINDVHTTGIQLATSFMKDGGLVPKVFDSGGTLDTGANLVYNLTGSPERLHRGGGGNGTNITLEIASSGNDFDHFMLDWLRKTARVKGGKGNDSVQVAFGRK